MHDERDHHHTTTTITRIDLANAVDLELVRIAQGPLGEESVRAAEELVTRHERTIRRAVGNDDESLLAVGRQALRRAVRSYDTDHRLPFGTYATARVRDAIRNRRVAPPTTPTNRLRGGRFLQVRISAGALHDQLHRSPTLTEVAEDLGFSTGDVLDALAVRSADRVRTTQLSACMAGGTPTPDVTGAASELDERTRLVLHRLLCDNRSRREVASELGLSTFDVADLEARGRRRVAEATDG